MDLFFEQVGVGLADLLEGVLQGEALVGAWFFGCGMPCGEFFGHCAGIAEGDFSGGEEGVELFADSSVVVSGDGFAKG